MSSTRPARARARIVLFQLSAALLGTAATLGAQEPDARPARVLTLDEAVALAVENDPLAVAAATAVDNAEASLLQARGSLLPSVSASTFYSNSSNQRFDQATGRLLSASSYTAQLQGGYDLFTGGRRLAQNRAASAQVVSAEASYRAQRFATALRTTQLFYEAAAASDLLRAAEQRLARARQQLEFAQTRLELGTATTSDVLRAELELGNAELAELDARSALRTSSLELGRQVGLEEPVRPAEGALPLDAPELQSADQLIARAMRTSPGLVAAEATLRTRRAERFASYTPYLPTLRVSGGYDWFSFDWPPRDRSWSMRVTASLPIFNNFDREASLQRAAAAERLADARARDAALAARVQVESAVQEIVSAERRVQISERAVELAREDLRVQEERYQIGAATILELQTSQLALADAEVAAVRARQGLGTAVAQLEAVLGEEIGAGE